MGRLTSAIRSVLWKMQVYSLLSVWAFESKHFQLITVVVQGCIFHTDRMWFYKAYLVIIFTGRQRSCWERNFFTGVCLSFCLGEGAHVTIPHDALVLTVQGPHRPQPQPLQTWDPTIPSPSSDIWWSLDVFIRPHCTGPLQVLTSGGHRSMYSW